MKIKFKYIDKLPELDQVYFQHWKETERIYLEALMWSVTFDNTNASLDAKALYDCEQLTHDLDANYRIYQPCYKQAQCKDCKQWTSCDEDIRDIPQCWHCQSMNMETWWFIWYGDFETADVVRDLKTSASAYTMDQIKELIRQAMIYHHCTGKQVKFAIANKKNHTVQIIPFVIKSLDRLRQKVEEIRFAFEMQTFPATPSYKCKMCSYCTACPFSFSYRK